MEIGITYLQPHDDDGDSTILSLSLSLSCARARARVDEGSGTTLADTRVVTFAYDESKTITIQSLCSASFAYHRLPCRALHTATAVG